MIWGVGEGVRVSYGNLQGTVDINYTYYNSKTKKNSDEDKAQ